MRLSRTKRLVATALIMALPCTALAYRPSREPVYDGNPVTVHVAPGSTVYLSVPFDIVEFSLPPGVEANQVTMQIPTNFPKNLRIQATDPPDEVLFQVPTNANKSYAIKLVRSKHADSWVTIQDAPPVRAEAAEAIPEPVKYMQKNYGRLKDVSTSPFDDALAALWYTMWGQDPRRAIYGVTMEAVDIIRTDTPREMVKAIWFYQGSAGVHGWTLLVVNRSLQPKALDVRTLDDARSIDADLPTETTGRLGFLSLDVLDRRSPEYSDSVIPPGGSALLHLTYIDGEATP